MSAEGSNGSVGGSVPGNPEFKGSVRRCLEGKNIVLTGGTGFVGKVVVEKLLRSVPDLGRLYVLVRPRKGESAQERLEKEVLQSPIFNLLRQQRSDFWSFARSKTFALAGDMMQQNVGLSDKDLQMVHDTVHVIIHCAASVDFNERLDRALELNCLGSLRLLDIGKKCKQLGAFIHVSTCYVNSNRAGSVDEKLYPLGFDPEQMVNKIRQMHVTELERVVSTGLLGDWPNTYTFTKAMTERLMVQRKESVPLVILRPSIVGCAWKEPAPGWVDVVSAAGAVYVAAGLGVVKVLPGSPATVADLIPVDYVVNSILAAIPAIYNERNSWFIAQAASSSENPVSWGLPASLIPKWFAEHPSERRIAMPNFVMTPSPQLYQILFFYKYSLPSALLNTIALFGSPKSKKNAEMFNKMIWRARVISESFKHFFTNEWRFDNRNTRAIGLMLDEEERKIFPLTLEDMDWAAYNLSFAYGLEKWVLKDDLQELKDAEPVLDLAFDVWKKEEPMATAVFRQMAKDLAWSKDRLAERSRAWPQPRPLAEMMSIVLNSPTVQAAIKAEAAQVERTKTGPKKGATGPSISGVDAVNARARDIAERMFGDTSMPVVSGLGWFFRKVWRRIYQAIEVDMRGLNKVREAAKSGPLIFIPTHRSYLDFLVVSYVCLACDLPLPFIAAGEDFLGILLVRWLFRKSGAFFMRRTFMTGDPLYTAIFREYVTRLMQDGQSLEFFIEGTRSRSGKMLHPKLGLLSIITDACFDKRVANATIVPLTINYEKTMEGNLYVNELQGDNKIRESLRSLLMSSSVLTVDFGRISVKFADPIPLDKFKEQHTAALAGVSALPPRLFYTPSGQAVLVPETMLQSPPPLVSLTAQATPVTSPVEAASPVLMVQEKPKDTAESKFVYDPVHVPAHRKHFNRTLGYKIVHDLSRHLVIWPTHLVATILLMYRQGVTKATLRQRTTWLAEEVAARGGIVKGVQGHNSDRIVDSALKYLGGAVTQRRQDVYEPAISARSEYKNMLLLGQFRNQLVHLFFREGIWACALYALTSEDVHGQFPQGPKARSVVTKPEQSSPMTPAGSASTRGTHSVDKAALDREVAFLHALLHREFIYKSTPDVPEDLEASFNKLVAQGVFKVTGSSQNPRVEVASPGENLFSFLCAIIWPFIDSYYAAALVMFSLQPDREVEENLLVQRTQWLATTLYHESMLCFYESCSLETLRNALHIMQEWRVISIHRGGKDRKQMVASLLQPYQEDEALDELVQHIGRLRKQPLVKKLTSRKNIVADIPILAKL